MHQRSLAKEGFEKYRKPTRRERFLAEMEQIMPGQYLINHPTPYSRFTVGDLTTPGAFHWTSPEIPDAT